MGDQLAPDEAAQLEAHLKQCQSCEATLERLMAERTLADSSAPRVRARRSDAELQAAIAAEAVAEVVESPPPALSDSQVNLPTVSPAPEANPTSRTELTHCAGPRRGGAAPGTCDFLAPAQGPNEIGRIAHYAVLKVLGKGGMGIVFKAEDQSLRRLVALKVMLPDLAQDELARQRFLREARAIAAVKNDHIVTIYEAEEDLGIPFLAMEFLEGCPLDKWLGQGNQPTVPEILRIGKEIARGLGAAHDRGLIHRDIKPGNIWLEAPAGRVKVLDFGLVRAVNEDLHLTKTGLIVGTPAYMAPEQASGDEIDHRADLFSLGCLLYRLSAGELPFCGTSTIALLKALALRDPRPLRDLNPNIPVPLADLVSRLLAKKPEHRPATAHAVAEVLETIERQLAATSPAAPAATIRLDLSAGGDTGTPRHGHAGIGRPSLRVPVSPRTRVAVAGRRRRSSFSWGTALLALALLGGGAGLAYFLHGHIQASKGVLEILSENPRVQIIIERDGVPVKIVYPEQQKLVELGVGTYHVRLGENGQGLAPDPENVTLSHEERAVLTIKRGAPRPAAGFKPVEAGWRTHVAELPANAQVVAVLEKLRERNPGFDGDLKPEFDNGRVVGLKLTTEKVTDLTPLQALPHLKQLILQGPGQLSDLAPLKGLRLEMLDCGDNQVQDLSPLHWMPLQALFLGANPVRDLSPLRESRLRTLVCQSPHLADLTPLQGLPLRGIMLDYRPERDAKVLRGIRTLETINNKPAAQFWQEQELKAQ
jgi:hypothetical protein